MRICTGPFPPTSMSGPVWSQESVVTANSGLGLFLDFLVGEVLFKELRALDGSSVGGAPGASQ